MKRTIKSIVTDLIKHLSDEDKTYFRKTDTTLERHGLGMHVRNEYGLWNPDHPLTANWHQHPETRDIRDGIDYSPDHPDNISGTIVEALQLQLKNQA